MKNLAMLPRRGMIGRLGAAALYMAGLSGAQAQPLVTLVVPFVAGSPTDVAARAFAAEFSTALSQPVIVENKPGGAQSVAGSFVHRAAADGTVLLFSAVPAPLPPSLAGKLSYSKMSDFEPISNLAAMSLMLAVSNNVPAKTAKEFVDLLKRSPADFTYGSSGIGSPLHLIGELFNKEVGVKTLHIPYKGANQILMDLISDRISYAFLPTSSMDMVTTGKIRALGSSMSHRGQDFPSLPTLQEAGLSNFEAAIDLILVAPPKTPAPVLQRLNKAANAVLQKSSFKEKIRSIGSLELAGASSPEEVRRFIVGREQKWQNLITSANIALE